VGERYNNSINASIGAMVLWHTSAKEEVH